MFTSQMLGGLSNTKMLSLCVFVFVHYVLDEIGSTGLIGQIKKQQQPSHRYQTVVAFTYYIIVR